MDQITKAFKGLPISESVSNVVQWACYAEASARKLGNVHPWKSFDDLRYSHFLIAADMFKKCIQTQENLPFAERIYQVVDQIISAIHTNANLGIILLLSPLIDAIRCYPGLELQESVRLVLQKTTVADSCLVFQAIQKANPGGLEPIRDQDIHSEPTLPLREVMAIAAPWDLIARQYADFFRDIFFFGIPRLMEGLRLYQNIEAAIMYSQLYWLASYPDSLIARKNGIQLAREIQMIAQEILDKDWLSTQGQSLMIELDNRLRDDNHRYNPGTIADLITATLFITKWECKIPEGVCFRWDFLNFLDLPAK